MQRRTTRDLSREGAQKKRSEEARTECSVSLCPNATNGRKPYCLEHLDRLPYVQKILTELAHFDVVASDPAVEPPEARAAAG